MDIISIIDRFNEHQDITNSDVTWLTNNKPEVYDYFILNPHRDLSVVLLNILVDQRIEKNDAGPGIEDLMFACLLVTVHQQIEDCLLIWEAKNTDFDTYCGMDIQLIAFMGVAATVSYLERSSDPDAPKALDYVLACHEGEDFEELDNYYAAPKSHWWMT